MSIPNHFIEEKERTLIFKLQNLAIARYGSIRNMAKYCGMNRKIMDRVQARGVYSLTSFSALKICIALHITPNQLYGFEPLPEIKAHKPDPEKKIDLKQISYREMHYRMDAELFRSMRRG